MGKESFFGKLLDNTPLAVIVIGVVLLIMGAAGGLSKPEVNINEFGWRIAVAFMGVLTALGGGLLFWRKESQVDQKNAVKYGFRITSPVDGQEVDVVDVRGTYQHKPPAEAIISVFELTPSRNELWPKSIEYIDLDETKKTWRAERVRVGSSVGQKVLAVAVVGKAGQALLDYYQRVAERTNPHPGILRLTPDMVICDRVSVKRSTPRSSP